MSGLKVGLVSPEREVWSGEAEMVVAQTIDGEIGIRFGHAPVLGVLVDGSLVKIHPVGGGDVIVAAVGSGFFSVADNEVAVLAEQAELGQNIDVAQAKTEYTRAQSGGDADETQVVAERRARARLRAAGVEA
ncbi:MAG: F0F1 ATP synthase subunit epsilon [Streptosporangiaceae bacterium]